MHHRFVAPTAVGIVAVAALFAGCTSFEADPAPAGGALGDGGGTDGSQAADGERPIGDGGADGGPSSDRYAAEVIADAPLAYFRLEESSGALKNEIAATASTVSAVVTGDVSYSAEGIAGRGLRLNSPTGSRLSVFGGTEFSGDDEFTIEAWVELDGRTPGQPFVFNNMDEEPRAGQWMYMFEGLLRVETWTTAKNHIFYADAHLPMTLSWVHVVFLHHNGLDVLYVDGATNEFGRVADAGTRIAPTAGLSWAGFVGRIDEIAIYAKALPPARIAVHHNAGAAK